jgi:hypothetical protein
VDWCGWWGSTALGARGGVGLASALLLVSAFVCEIKPKREFMAIWRAQKVFGSRNRKKWLCLDAIYTGSFGVKRQVFFLLIWLGVHH